MIQKFLGTALLVTALPALAAGPDELINPWFAQGREAVAEARATPVPPAHARNVILFVGDGMGVPTVTAARILAGQKREQSGEENWLSFETFPWLALVKTYNTDQQIPDSAGTVTAMLSGVKTRAGVIGVDETAVRGDPATVAASRIPNLFEQAHARGLGTGVVTTTRITHATPAGAYAHTPERNWEDDRSLSKAARRADFPDIAQQLVAFPNGSSEGLDLVLGGGRRAFLPSNPPPGGSKGKRADGQNLVAAWQAGNPNRTYVRNLEELQALEPRAGKQVLGLFADSHMSFEADREADHADEPSLARMTRFAIDLLSKNPRGYVLLVEGGRIDHAHHANNAYRALTDTLAFDEAVAQALEQTDPKKTLILVTADHGHPISLRGYPVRGNPILGQVMENDATDKPPGKPAHDQHGQPYTTLSYGAGPGFGAQTGSDSEAMKPHDDASEANTPSAMHSKKTNPRDPDYRQEATRPLAYGTHSGEDVPLYATGPGADLFRGVIEQNYIYHAITEALGWNDAQQENPEP